MVIHKRTLILLLTLPSAACDAEGLHEEELEPSGYSDEAEESEDSGMELPEGFEASQLPMLETEVVATVEVDGVEVQFIAREPLGGEGDERVIDMAEIGSGESTTVLDGLLERGATPLEVLEYLQPGGPRPQVMVADHERLARAAGRQTNVRMFDTFRDGGTVAHFFDQCSPLSFSVANFLFNEHIDDIRQPGSIWDVEVGSLTEGGQSIWLKSLQDSSDNVAVRICNKPKYFSGGCHDDRFKAYVFSLGPGGGGNAWSGWLEDCDMLKYHWSNQIDNQYYGTQLVRPQYRYQGAGWRDCDEGNTQCEARYAFHGVVIK